VQPWTRNLQPRRASWQVETRSSVFRTGDPAITILAQLLHVLPLRIQDSIERPDLGGRRSKIRGPTPFEIPFGLTASSSCSNRSMC
jgi:hypothetical protein